MGQSVAHPIPQSEAKIKEHDIDDKHAVMADVKEKKRQARSAVTPQGDVLVEKKNEARTGQNKPRTQVSV